MRMYAVKHKHKELFLPVVKGSNSKAELSDPMEQSPRLFKSYKGAAQAMYSWAKGITSAQGYWNSGDEGPSWFEITKIFVTPQKHRKLSDVCVVEVFMTFTEIDR